MVLVVTGGARSGGKVATAEEGGQCRLEVEVAVAWGAWVKGIEEDHKMILAMATFFVII